MSGVFGVLSKDVSIQPVLSQMGETLRHFSWHQTDIFSQPETA